MSSKLCSFIPDTYVVAKDKEKFFDRVDLRIVERHEGRENPKVGVPNASCNTNLFFGFFFDGTKNNYRLAAKANEYSNVARLYDAFPGQSVPGVLPKGVDWKLEKDSRFLNFFRVYVPGVASPFPDINDGGDGLTKLLGGAMGRKGNDRIVWALIQAINNVHRFFYKQPLLSSEEATSLVSRLYLSKEARALMSRNVTRPHREYRDVETVRPRAEFENLLRRLHARVAQHWSINGARPKKIDPAIVQTIFISTLGFSRGATQARAFANWLDSLCRLDAQILGKGGTTLGGFPVSFDFLGLFDTVASVGPGNTYGDWILSRLLDGHSGWADADDSLRIPGSIKRCVHLVAAHEQRRSFPLDSVAVGFAYPSNAEEIVFPGVHSDVGGGYAPMDHGKGVNANGKDMLSRLPLLYMYKVARLAGVPLKLELADKDVQKKFEVDAKVINDFNAYLSQCKRSKGSLTDIMREQQILQMGWRYFRRADGGNEINRTNSFKRASNFDKNDLDSSSREFSDELNEFEKQLQKWKKQKLPKQSPGFGNSFVREWQEIARHWPITVQTPEIVHFFDEYVHDSRAAFKLSGADNPTDAVNSLQEWSRILAVRKSLYSNPMPVVRMSRAGPPDYGMDRNERMAAEAFDRERKAKPNERDLTKLIPRYINEGREPSFLAEAGYFRFRKIYGGSDDVLLSQSDSEHSGKPFNNLADIKAVDDSVSDVRRKV